MMASGRNALNATPPPPRTPLTEDDAASAAPFDIHRPSHWLMRLGSPLGISLLFHAALLLVFAAVTWAVSNRGDDANLEFEAKIIAEGPTGGPAGGYRFPGE